jgi:hypothetical protein
MPMSTSLSGREVPFVRLPNSHTSRTLLVRAAHCRINSTLSAGRSFVPLIFLCLALPIGPDGILFSLAMGGCHKSAGEGEWTRRAPLFSATRIRDRGRC